MPASLFIYQFIDRSGSFGVVKIRLCLNVVMIAAITLSCPAYAKPRLVDAAAFDVASVKLGMTPEEARQALVTHGYSVGADSMAESWNARVASEAGKYANTPKDNTRAVYATQAEGPESQKVEVLYEITASGSHARKITYSRPGSQGDIRSVAIQKYGQPTRVSMNAFRYCSEIKDCPQYLYDNAPSPSMEVLYSYSGRSSVILSQGKNLDMRWQAAFSDAVRKLAPNYGKAAF